MTASASRRQRPPDPFKVLGIARTATPAEVTAAYRKLAKQYHPDKFQEKPDKVRREAEDRMAALNQAYKVAREKVKSGDIYDEDVYGTRSRSRARSEPWTGSEVGAWSRTAKRTESSAARAARLAASRQAAERAAREHETQARVFQRIRLDAKRSARYGDAVARSKSRLLTRVPSVLTGAGQAVHTNEITCRNCRTIQRLPGNWHDRLVDTAYFCSDCDTVLLNR